MRHKSCGFSLFELVVVLLLVSVLAGLAVAGFADVTARSRLRAEVDALFHAVHLARKESVTRRQVVSLCPAEGREQCAGTTDWSTGWIMFNNRDADDPPRIDAGEPILQRHAVHPEVRISANRRGFTLRATHKRATNGTLVVCDRTARVSARGLIISYTGRPRVALLDRSGDPYDCAE